MPSTKLNVPDGAGGDSGALVLPVVARSTRTEMENVMEGMVIIQSIRSSLCDYVNADMTCRGDPSSCLPEAGQSDSSAPRGIHIGLSRHRHRVLFLGMHFDAQSPSPSPSTIRINTASVLAMSSMPSQSPRTPAGSYHNF
jgi:hypothetical protein